MKMMLTTAEESRKFKKIDIHSDCLVIHVNSVSRMKRVQSRQRTLSIFLLSKFGKDGHFTC